MALSDVDRNLLERCLARKPKAWEDFVDRFMGLVIHVLSHTAQARSVRLTAQDKEDVCAEVFLTFLREDMSVLRSFRGHSSLATYLTVIARRVAVKEILRRRSHARLSHAAAEAGAAPEPVEAEQRISDREEVERLIGELEQREAEIVRLYHLEGKSYQEIGSTVGLPANSVGPILSRAMSKMRNAGTGPSVAS